MYGKPVELVGSHARHLSFRVVGLKTLQDATGIIPLQSLSQKGSLVVLYCKVSDRGSRQ